MHIMHRNELPRMGAQGEPRHGRRVSTVSSGIANLKGIIPTVSWLRSVAHARECVHLPVSGNEAPPYCHYLQLLCQLLIFFKKLIDFLNIIIRLHGQCRFVNWSDNLLFFFQVICYLCHTLVLLQLFYNQ